MIFKEKGKTKHPEKRDPFGEENQQKLNPRLATLKTRRELEPKCVPQLSLGSCRSAIHCFSVP